MKLILAIVIIAVFIQFIANVGAYLVTVEKFDKIGSDNVKELVKTDEFKQQFAEYYPPMVTVSIIVFVLCEHYFNFVNYLINFLIPY